MIKNKEYFAPMHTAEHILNQTMVRMFNCDRSFSNHIERKKSKCDYKFSKALTEEEIKEIEQKVNEIINLNLDITEEFITRAEAEKEYNTANLPELAGETLRVVKVGEYDKCLCIGDHVKNTSEIGTFKISTYSYENNILRIRYKLLSKENN